MTHYEAILNHIKADTPCSYSHVTGWAVSQGFGGTQMVKAIRQLFNDRIINIETIDGDVVVELVSETI
jgi:hypothetical protein